MRTPLWRTQQQHCLIATYAASSRQGLLQRLACFAIVSTLLLCGMTAADFTDVVETANNYALADVAADNAKLIHQLLQSKWNASSAAAIEDALRSASTKKGIYGAAAAFSPAAIKQYNITDAPLYSPYCHEAPTDAADVPSGNITCMDIGNLTDGAGYNYTNPNLSQTNWYTQFYKMPEPMAKMSGVYFDKGAGEIWMDTYSVPVMSPDGKTLLAVATADIRIETQTNGAHNTTRGAESSAATVGPHWSHVLLLWVLSALLGSLLLQ